MDDIRQYNNDGGDSGIDKPISTSKPKRPWIRLSIVLIILGALLILGGFATGSRGGRIHFDRGLRIESFSAAERIVNNNPHFESNSTVHTVIVNDARFRTVTIVPTSNPTLSVTGAEDIDLNVTEIDGVVVISPTGIGGADIIGFRNSTNLSLMDFGGAFGISYVSGRPLISTDMNLATGNNFREGDRVRYLQYNIGGRVSFGGAIRVYMPSSVQYLNVNTTSGTIRINNESTLSVLTVNSSSGNIHVNGGTIIDGGLRSTSGTIRVNDTTVQGGFSAQSSSGNIHFNGDRLPSGYFRSTSGTIRVNATVDENFFAQSSSGNIHFDGDRLPSGYFRSTSGTIRVNATVDENFSAQSGSGNIHFNGDRLTHGSFQSTSGTIRVDTALEGNFSAVSSSGNIHVNDNSRTSTGGYQITLRANSGTVRFNTSASVSHFNYNVNVGSGTIRTEGSRRDGRTFSSGNGDTNIIANTSSGNVHLNFSR